MDAAKNKKAGARSAKKKKGLAYEIRKALKIGKSDYYDFNLVAVIILIMCFGLIMLYSTSSYMAQINEGDDMFYFKKQALYSIGCLVMAITTTLTAVKCLQEKALWRHMMQMYSFPAQMQSQAMALWSTLMEIPIVSPALPRVQEK